MQEKKDGASTSKRIHFGSISLSWVPQWPCQMIHCRKSWIAPNFFLGAPCMIRHLSQMIYKFSGRSMRKMLPPPNWVIDHQKRLHCCGFKSLQWPMCPRTKCALRSVFADAVCADAVSADARISGFTHPRIWVSAMDGRGAGTNPRRIPREAVMKK